MPLYHSHVQRICFLDIDAFNDRVRAGEKFDQCLLYALIMTFRGIIADDIIWIIVNCL